MNGRKQLSVTLALLLSAACGSENSLVGGRCADGLARVGDTCQDTSSAPPYLGSSDPSTDGDAPAPIAKVPHRHDPGPSPLSDPPPSFELPNDLLPPDELPPPEVTPPPALVCGAPLVACGGECIPVASDTANCGACGKYCPTNICVDGECQGSFPGDVILIGHDFASAYGASPETKVLVNAASIPTTDPIRILSVEAGAATASLTQAKALLRSGIKGRGVAIQPVTSAAYVADTNLAAHYDIVLLHEAAGDDPQTLGASWAASLGHFTQKGGVILAIDGATSDMPQLLSSAALLSIADHELLAPESRLRVTAPNDVVGVQVLSPYAPSGTSVAFLGIEPPSPDVTYVVRQVMDGEQDGPPVVVHKVMR
jgi:hypothetical protein